MRKKLERRSRRSSKVEEMIDEEKVSPLRD